MLLFYPPHLRGESGCKDKYFHIFHPNLSALFFKLFFRTAAEESFCRLHPQKMKNTSVKMFQNVRFVSESGCKGKDFFITSKLFKRNFWSFFQTSARAISWRTLHNLKNCKPTHHTHSPTPAVQPSWFPIAAAKIASFKYHFQIFFTLFFEKNESFRTRCWFSIIFFNIHYWCQQHR